MNTYSLSLNGASSQYCFRGNDSNFQNMVASFTIEFWIKTTSDNFDILSRYDDSNAWIWRVEVSGGKITFSRRLVGQNNPLNFNGSTSIKDGNWHHVAIVRDDSTGYTYLYIDTMLDATDNSNTQQLQNHTDTFIVNGHLNSGGSAYNFSTFKIDDLRFWTIVRSATDLSNNWKRELAGNETGLMAYYTFDNTYNDLTSNGLNLGVSGIPSFDTDVPFADTTTTSTSTTTTSTSTSTTTTSTSTSSTSTSTSTSTTTSTTTSTSSSTSTTTTQTSTSTTTTSTSTTTTSTSTTTTSTSTTTTTSTSTSTTITIALRFMIEKVR